MRDVDVISREYVEKELNINGLKANKGHLAQNHLQQHLLPCL